MKSLNIIGETIKLIERELKYITSIEYISNKLGYSKSYLNRLFTNTFGITVLDYIKMRKITEGIIKCKNSSLNIVDIAFEFGFNSHEVFIRNSKKYFNRVPNELILDNTWSGFKQIQYESLWYLKNRDNIIKKTVKLPNLILAESDNGNIFIPSLGFRGIESELLWDVNNTYKLVPKGIYISFKINVDNDDFVKYLMFKYPKCSTVIKVENNDSYIYYIKYISSLT